MKRECDSFLYGETRNGMNTKEKKLFQLKENVAKEQKNNMETSEFCQVLCRRLQTTIRVRLWNDIIKVVGVRKPC